MATNSMKPKWLRYLALRHTFSPPLILLNASRYWILVWILYKLLSGYSDTSQIRRIFMKMVGHFVFFLLLLFLLPSLSLFYRICAFVSCCNIHIIYICLKVSFKVNEFLFFCFPIYFSCKSMKNRYSKLARNVLSIT